MAERALGDQAAGMLHANACANAVRPHPRKERIRFTGSADTMRSFFAQPDHIGVFHYVVDCLDFMMM